MRIRSGIAVTLILIAAQFLSTARADQPQKIIIDTDIGSDIDDAFAVALALRSPEFNLLGIATASGDTRNRARILDHVLGEVGRQDNSVAVGIPTTLPDGGNVDQARYGMAGHFERPTHPEAVAFLRDRIERNPNEITLVAIGPLTNVGAQSPNSGVTDGST